MPDTTDNMYHLLLDRWDELSYSDQVILNRLALNEPTYTSSPLPLRTRVRALRRVLQEESARLAHLAGNYDQEWDREGQRLVWVVEKLGLSPDRIEEHLLHYGRCEGRTTPTWMIPRASRSGTSCPP